MLDVPSISNLRTKVDRVIGSRDAAQRHLEQVQTEIKSLENEETLLGLVCELFRQLIDSEINEGVQAVERLQTEGLQAVFVDQDISVRGEVEVQRGKVSVDLITVQQKDAGMVVEGLSKDSFGGSVLTLQSILMRMSVIIRRGLRRVIIMDESLPAFDEQYVSHTGTFLTMVCKRLGIDLFLVTHNTVLVESSGRGYRLTRKPGGVKFERLHG